MPSLLPSGIDSSNLLVRTYRAMKGELSMAEIRRRLSWGGFLAPLSESELDDLLLRRATFVRLAERQELIIGSEEQAERMLLVAAGQLQVYVMSPQGES